MDIELSIVILTRNEAENISVLIPRIRTLMEKLPVKYEILIMDGKSSDNTVEIARSLGCRVIVQNESGYGNAFRQAFKEAGGEYIINIDADCSHDPKFMKNLWEKREGNQLVIASRYVSGGQANMPVIRNILSIILNRVYAFVLSLPFKDLSSGFRLYRTRDVRKLINDVTAKDFDVLLEVLIRCYCEGYNIAETPFSYQPRSFGKSSAKILKFGISYIKTLFKSWKLRASSSAADYDDKAFNSIIPFQRWWQRRRYEAIFSMLKGSGRIADLGCGSSRIIQNLPNSVGLDLDLKKLRYIKGVRKGQSLVQASISDLPFKSGAFREVICSQVIEHIPKEAFKPEEFHRILEKGGHLIIGTPDYASSWWNFIEWFYIKLLPFSYGEGHISHYTKDELEKLLEVNHFKVLGHKYVFKGELIISAQKI